ncbi:hypothetical protein LJR078_001760 [Arthrobacter sp. LjRoot78]
MDELAGIQVNDEQAGGPAGHAVEVSAVDGEGRHARTLARIQAPQFLVGYRIPGDDRAAGAVGVDVVAAEVGNAVLGCHCTHHLETVDRVDLCGDLAGDRVVGGEAPAAASVVLGACDDETVEGIPADVEWPVLPCGQRGGLVRELSGVGVVGVDAS